MNMPKEIYMRDDGGGSIELTSGWAGESVKYVLCGDADIKTDAILALCQRLQAAAIKCDDYHVFVSYAPHVSGLAVCVERTDTEYQNPDRVLDRIIDEMVYIDMPDSMEKLTDIVDQLQSLGVKV